jgi:CRISPR/Cas system-associated exonuclease Cas4 (RecB family)
VLQRAENIFLFYNTETNVLGQGEMSRYLHQLIFESGLKIEKQVLHNPVEPTPLSTISIKKDENVLKAIYKLNEGNSKFQGISPSAINSYIECRLKFYFRYVARIKEPDEVEEDIDARVLGNFLHEVMERFYKGLQEKKNSKLVEQADFDGTDPIIDKLIDDAFIEEYRLEPTRKVDYEGQRLVVREIVKRFADKILEKDKIHAPFNMEAIEKQGLLCTLKIDHAPGTVVIGGTIDRVDSKDNQLRIVDYKTGRDSLGFDSVESLFARDEKRNKAAFQTLLYALLYNSNHPETHGMLLSPGLINRDYLFGDSTAFGLKMDRHSVKNASDLLPEFELFLKNMLEEIFDPSKEFDQTTSVEHCRLCPYQNICYR